MNNSLVHNRISPGKCKAQLKRMKDCKQDIPRALLVVK